MVPLIGSQPVDRIIPVPLHPHRLAQRGFNQAALLAQALGKLTGIPVDLHSLVRITPTLSQHGFSSQQRWDNVHQAFKALPCVAHRRILLVDDVCTTGATLNASATALRAQNARHVNAITVAKVLM
jgi:ComF family protein